MSSLLAELYGRAHPDQGDLAPRRQAFANRVDTCDTGDAGCSLGSGSFTWTDQSPGGAGTYWVTAVYGKGHYSYFAYSLHRQLPYGVPGAYRLLANLLSLGK